MSEVTWQDLAKTVIDKTKISEEIDEDIKTHTEDPSAHKQTGEAIDTHRTAAILDHIDEAVKNVKIQSGARAYTAIVDAGGGADYTTIQAAINYVNGLGGGNILIKNGTYTQAADIVLYSNINLVGESKDATIIDFNNTHYRIYLYAVAGIKNIEISKLKIKNWQYNNTYPLYRGAIYMSGAENIVIKDCYFEDNDDPVGDIYGDIYIYGSSRIYIRDNYFLNSDDCSVHISGAGGSENYHIVISENYFKGGVGARIRAIYAYYLKIINNSVVDPEFIYSAERLSRTTIIGNYVSCSASITNAIYIKESNGTKIIGNTLKGLEAGYGVVLEDNARLVMIGNSIRIFGNDGLKLIASDSSIINGNCIDNNGGWGINISNATCDKNIVISNYVLANTSGQIQDNGTNTEVAHNITV